MKDDMTASGVAQIRALIDRKRQEAMALPGSDAFDAAEIAIMRFCDELEAALLAVDAPSAQQCAEHGIACYQEWICPMCIGDEDEPSVAVDARAGDFVMTASGVAQIQQLIAKWRDMHSMTDYDGNNYPEGFYRAEDYANELDELLTALLAVDAPPTLSREDQQRLDAVCIYCGGHHSGIECQAVDAPPPQAEEP